MEQLDPTIELQITFDAENNKKPAVIAWLIEHGENNFVEGVIDGLDLFEFEHLEDEHCPSYDELGGDETPLCVYKYSQDEMTQLKAGLEEAFGAEIAVKLSFLDTEKWQTGWKDSFKPIYTERFCIHPPWDKPEGRDPSRLLVEIDPGMAFGTGQHATTQLCLKALESLAPEYLASGRSRVLDVGTGSGVLAIAAYKLGFRMITATDIDADAMTAAQRNMVANQAEMALLHGSGTKAEEGYDLVVANILAIVIKKIRHELLLALAPGGTLVISGILVEEIPEMRALFAPDLAVSAAWQEEGWAALCLRAFDA